VKKGRQPRVMFFPCLKWADTDRHNATIPQACTTTIWMRVEIYSPALPSR